MSYYDVTKQIIQCDKVCLVTKNGRYISQDIEDCQFNTIEVDEPWRLIRQMITLPENKSNRGKKRNKNKTQCRNMMPVVEDMNQGGDPAKIGEAAQRSCDTESTQEQQGEIQNGMTPASEFAQKDATPTESAQKEETSESAQHAHVHQPNPYCPNSSRFLR